MEIFHMTEVYKGYYSSPIGLIEIVGSQEGISFVGFVEKETSTNPEIPSCLKECFEQVDEYFNGKRREFSLNIHLEGTLFQKRVWKALLNIPFGKTASYLEIARSIGSEKAVRAVGNANGSNPVSIIVPCHRIIGHDGRLVGYGGGLWRKEWLLKHEGITSVSL